MSWKKHFRPTNSVLPVQNAGSVRTGGKVNNFNNWLPELYQGPPDRLQRYATYEAMDADNDVHSALNIITDFSTEIDEVTKLPFVIEYSSDPTPSEIQIINRTLSQWVALNDFKKRLWPMVRGVLKYGDQIFIRDPETYKLFWCDIAKVTEAIVNEIDGKKIEGYKIKDFDLNLHSMVATKNNGTQGTLMNNNGVIFSPPINTNFNTGQASYVASGQSATSETSVPVNANHVVHLTLSDGMNQGWPFGQSILESIFKTFKQRELLEDAILIYRVHRAPERRVFFIDVGTLPPNKANAYLERMKYEVQQKRIPSKNGGGSSITDSGYSPMSMLEDYFFAVTSDGRSSRVETLPGGEGLGNLEDLKYFSGKMFKALGIPSSYLPSNPDDAGGGFNDGRVGTAFIQEFTFSKICKRYQKQIIGPLDQEFKLFLKMKGVDVDNSLFELEFTPPQSFSEYRQMELDAAHINIFGAISEVPYVSKRFALKRYLGWTEGEIEENERLLVEEKGKKKSGVAAGGPVGSAEASMGSAGLSDAGITPSGIDGMTPEGGFEDAPADADDVGDTTNDPADIDSFGEEENAQ